MGKISLLLKLDFPNLKPRIRPERRLFCPLEFRANFTVAGVKP
jgi:hypothetical protein